jgi:hypothetical protein
LIISLGIHSLFNGKGYIFVDGARWSFCHNRFFTSTYK